MNGDGGARVGFIVCTVPPSSTLVHSMEVPLWAHYLSLLNKSSDKSSEEPEDAPSSVQALALLQLKSLQAGVSLGSLASEVADLAPLPELLGVVVDGKPLQIAMSDWLSQSPMLSPRKQPKTLFLPESGQVKSV